MGRRKIINRVCRGLIVVLMTIAVSALSGCATYFANETVHVPEFDRSRLPDLMEGEYQGKVRQGSMTFEHYCFGAFLWPMSGKGQYMHIFLPEREAEPIVLKGNMRLPIHEPIPYYRDGWQTFTIDAVSDVRSKAFLHVYPRQEGGDFTEVIKKLTLGAWVIDPEITLVTLSYTKEGNQSSLLVGQLSRKEKQVQNIRWKGPYRLEHRPFDGRWRGPLDYWHYVITVPVDVVTFPLQLPFWAYWYVLYNGMSPK